MALNRKGSAGAFVAGVLMVNSLGHLATAVAGKEHLTPLAGRRSGPAVNALWGAMNLAGGLVLARRYATPGARWGRELHSLGAGAAAFGGWMFVSELVGRVNTSA